MTHPTDPIVGSRFEDFLEEQGIREEVYGEAIKRVLAWELEKTRVEQALTKTALADRLGTSRSQLDRILDPANLSVSIATLEKAAQALGKTLKVELVDR